MAARFPQSASSVAYKIKAAYSSKVLAIYWAATADSVHRLYPEDTATTILTRATSGAGFNATDGRITGTVTGTGEHFSDSKTGGLGTTESGSLTYIASYYGDLFNGIGQTWIMGCVAPMDVFANRQSLKVSSSYNISFVRPGGAIGSNAAGGNNNVAAFMVFGMRHVAADPTARYRSWANGAELTGVRSSSAPSSSVTVGDASNALRFGGTAAGTGNTRMEGECWIVATDLSDAEMDAITADPSIVIEEAASAPASDFVAGAGVASVSAVGSSLAASDPTAAAGSATVSAVGGTLVLLVSSALKNNTGTLLASISTWTVWVHNPTTGALVVKLTSQASSAGGVLTLQDEAIVTATSYRVVYRNEATGAEGMETLTAT